MEISPSRFIFGLLITAYFLFSLGYIANDLWQGFKTNELKQAYTQGQTDAIRKLISEAEKCQPFSAFADDKKVEIISTACLQGKAEPQAGAQ